MRATGYYEFTCDCGKVDPDDLAIVAIGGGLEVMDFTIGNHRGHDVELGDQVE